MAVTGDSAGVAKMVRWPIWPIATVGATHVEGFPRLVGKDGAAIAIVEIELPVGTCDEGMQTVIMIDRIESCKDDLTFIDLGIKSQIAIDISIRQEIWRLRNIDDVVYDCYAEWGDKPGFLYECVGTVAFPVAVGVLQNHDAISCRTYPLSSPIVDALGDPDSTRVIDVHVRRVMKKRSASPDGHFQRRIDRSKERWGNRSWFLRWFPIASVKPVQGSEAHEYEKVEAEHDMRALDVSREYR